MGKPEKKTRLVSGQPRIVLMIVGTTMAPEHRKRKRFIAMVMQCKVGKRIFRTSRCLTFDGGGGGISR